MNLEQLGACAENSRTQWLRIELFHFVFTLLVH